MFFLESLLLLRLLLFLLLLLLLLLLDRGGGIVIILITQRARPNNDWLPTCIKNKSSSSRSLFRFYFYRFYRLWYKFQGFEKCNYSRASASCHSKFQIYFKWPPTFKNVPPPLGGGACPVSAWDFTTW